MRKNQNVELLCSSTMQRHLIDLFELIMRTSTGCVFERTFPIPLAPQTATQLDRAAFPLLLALLAFGFP